jgi:hypothetical protein
MKLHLTRLELDDAAEAWKVGGHLALGLRRARLKCDYGDLVKAVRKYLGDDTDYSKAPAIHAAARAEREHILL